MKKYLILLSSLAASVAFAEKGSADKDNPTEMSTWGSFGGGTTAGEIIWNGNGATTADMTDSYVIADKDLTLGQFKISGTGGDHCNLNLDLNGKTLTFTNGIVGYNNTPSSTGGYTTNYTLGINFTNSDAANEATLNFTSSAVSLDLQTTDTGTGGKLRNRYGRTVSIGEGVTANMNNFYVSGRFQELSDPSKMEYDSKMSVAGKLNVTKLMTLTDTNFENTGTVSANAINIHGTNFTSTGSVLTGGISAYANSNIVLSGSNLSQDGTSQGTVRFYGKNNTLTTTADLAAQYLVLKSTQTDAEGNVTYDAAELTIKGDFTTDKIIMENYTHLTIDSGANVVFDFSSKPLSAMSIQGDLTVKGALDIKTPGGEHGAEQVSYKNILVDGGSLINTTTKTSTYAFNISDGKTITLKNGGTINTSATSFIGLTGGTLSVDATSKILAKHIVFNQSKGTLELSHASNLAAGTNIFVKDLSASANAKIVLTKCGEAYEIATLRALRNSQLTIDLNGAELHIASVAGYEPAKGSDLTLTFLDFENGLVKVDGWTSDLISSGEFEISPTTSGNTNTIKLVAYDKSGNLLSGLWSVDSNGFLANSAIPEPAEWAAIFGAIALGLAIYRRRK